MPQIIIIITPYPNKLNGNKIFNIKTAKMPQKIFLLIFFSMRNIAVIKEITK